MTSAQVVEMSVNVILRDQLGIIYEVGGYIRKIKILVMFLLQIPCM